MDRIIDNENLRSDSDDIYKTIVLEQVKKVANLGSTDFHEGFKIYAYPHPSMNPVPSGFCEDTEKAYRNAIDVLHDLLLPKFDKECQDDCESIGEDIAKIKKAHNEGKLTVESAKKRLLKCHREIFQTLCLLLSRMGWMESQGVHED